jgi:hypothetical protein
LPKLEQNDSCCYGAIAIVKRLEEIEGRFYAEAEIFLNEDVDNGKARTCRP